MNPLKKLKSYVLFLMISIPLLFASSIFGLAPAEGVSGYVKVSGRNIVDEFGRTITLRGFNLWGADWGYGPDSPNMKLTPAHMQQIKKWGFNFVKLAFYWTFWLEPDQNATSSYNEEFLSYIKWIIDIAWEAGLYSIIDVTVCYDPVDMPWWAGWSTHDYVVYNQVDTAGTHGLERFCNMWKMLVNRFDSHPGIIGYNPWSFPYHRQHFPDGDERVDLYNNNVTPALISAIREKSNKIIFWSPVHCGMNAYPDLSIAFETGAYGSYPPHWNQTRVPKALDDKNIVYMTMGFGDTKVSGNPEAGWDYDVKYLEQSLAFGKSFQDTYNVPMMSNEGPGLWIHYAADPGHPANMRPIRQGRLDMLAQVLSLFEDYPKNWAYFLYSGEKSAWGVLENGVTLEESAIVPVLLQHKAKILEGDFDHNGVIDIKDIAVVARAFGSYPGHENWNQMADLNADGIVDVRDIAKVARNFGKKI